MTLTPEERARAEEIYQEFGSATISYYHEFYVNSNSVQTIARMYRTTETDVRNGLRWAEGYLTEELHHLFVRYLTVQLDELEQRTKDSIRSTQAVVDDQAPAIDVARQALRHPATPLFLDVVSFKAAEHVPLILETTAAVVSAKSAWSLSSVLAALAMPLLWLMSMMTTGKAMGLALVKDAPTYYAKRWLVKQVFFCYATILVVPVVLYFAVYFLCNMSKDAQHLMGGVIWTCLFGGILVYFPWVNSGYQKAVKTETLFIDESRKLEILIYVGSKILTFISISFFLWYLISALPIAERFAFSEHWTIVCLSVLKIIGFGTLLFLYHSSGHYLFGELIMLTEDNETQNPKPIRTLIKEAVLNYWKKIKPELTYMAPFIIFTVGINVLHLTINRTRVVIACLEIAAVVPWWLLVLQHNIRDPKNRMRNIYITFLIMFVILFALRYFVYHPYDM